MRALALVFLTGCIAARGMARYEDRPSPRKEGGIVMALAVAEIVGGFGFAYLSLDAKPEEDPDSHSFSGGAGKSAGKNFLFAAGCAGIGVAGVLDLLAGLLQVASGDYLLNNDATLPSPD